MENVEFIALELSTKNHVTMAFRPSQEYIESVKDLMNKEFTITLKAFGEYRENGTLKNQGFFVELPNELKAFFKCKIPHTTTLVVNGGKAVDTYKMQVLYICNETVKGTLKAFFKGQH